MKNDLLRITFFLSLLLLLTFVVSVTNQTAEVVRLISTIHPRAGQLALAMLLSLYAMCLLVPVIIYARLPQPLTPPSSRDSPDFPEYLEALQRRLRTNPLVQSGGLGVADEQDVIAALTLLNRKAEEVIANTAGAVFVSTAVSQNGKLDGLLVLLTQTRLVWQVSRVYNQRPTLRDMVDLYSNVAATAFLTTSLSDIDVSQQIQPVIASLLGSAVSAVPGLTVATNLLANSLLQGAANAFLTLRVGAITRRYCSALVSQKRSILRHSASAEAISLLGGIVVEGTRSITSAFVEATKLTMHDVAGGTSEALKNLGLSVRDAMRRCGGRGAATTAE